MFFSGQKTFNYYLADNNFVISQPMAMKHYVLLYCANSDTDMVILDLQKENNMLSHWMGHQSKTLSPLPVPSYILHKYPQLHLPFYSCRSKQDCMIKMVSAEAWLDFSMHETQNLNLKSCLLKITVDLQRCQLENTFLARCFNHGKLYTIGYIN